MFGGGWASLATPSDLTEREREPPSDPTPLQFPSYTPSTQPRRLTRSSLQNLSDLLIAIRKPQDISAAHLEALNVDVQRDVPYADLVPKILEIHSPSSGGPRLSNGHPAPDQKVYEGLKSELLIPNDDAFREVNRMLPRPDREKPRVTQSRRFWAGLERMSQYWDTSLDEFYEVPTDDDNSKNNNELSGEEKPKGEPPSNSSKGTDGSRASNPGKMKRVYKGRRISTGKDMPEDCRDETIRRFLEMVVWPFRCQVVVPNVAPRITVGNVLFPVRHTFTAARSPEDYQMARKGVLEGPLLAVQCRGETTFRSDGEGVGDSQGEKLDLFREIGGMLLLAQGRAREGREEKRPGEGKWWVTVPRWGGGPGGDMETLMVEGEETAPVVEPEAKVRDAQPLDRSRNKRPRGTGQGPARRLSMAERWKILQPGPSLWDKKVKYMRIGANREMEEDDIYLISSLNHHLSILHLRVHPDHLAWLADTDANTNAGSEATTEVDAPKSSSETAERGLRLLRLRRTRWFDLFDAGDRVEAFEAVWAVVGWLMR